MSSTRIGAALTALLVTSACTGEPAPDLAPAPPVETAAKVEPSPPGPSERLVAEKAYWPERTDAALDTAIREACEASVAGGKPMLLEFSAPWCIDCKKVKSLKTEPALAAELAGWHTVMVNVGKFDRHEALRDAFSVVGIVTWVALAPADCSAPVTAYKRLDQSLFEPASGEGPKTAEALSAWLVAARAK